MTINAAVPIYNFRLSSPVIGRRFSSRSTPGQNAVKPQQLDLFDAQPMPARQVDSDVKARTATETEDHQTTSVSDLINRYFEDKIHRHDADRDGRLNQEEFFGSEEQFNELDEDGDGYVRATDLKRQSLDANPEMREMTQGFASELYDQMLNSSSSSPEELPRMVEDFFTEFVARHDTDYDNVLHADEFPGTNAEFRQIAGLSKQQISKEDLVRSFTKSNPDLVELRDSLMRLKQTVENPHVRQQNIDTYS